MSDLFGNHIVGFPTRRLIFQTVHSDSVRVLKMLNRSESVCENKIVSQDILSEISDTIAPKNTTYIN